VTDDLRAQAQRETAEAREAERETLFASKPPRLGLEEACRRLSALTGRPVPLAELHAACVSGRVEAKKTVRGWTVVREQLPLIARHFKR
jgi:hypothetical protein